jgi:glycosyltransferase involved in cell wall biosynthesis
MSNPSFTIVTAIKNGLELFKQTAPTILAQTERNWEWLIVDDGSTEPVAAYVWGLGDERVRCLRNETSQGQTPSLNRAIREARANWIVRMDGDDLAAPNRLAAIRARLGDALSPEGSGFSPLVFSDYNVIHEEGALVATVRYDPTVPPGFYNYMRERNNPLCHPTVAFIRDTPAGEPYAYDERLKNAQDYELWKRIHADYGRPFLHVPEPLVSYRLVRQSLSGARIREQRNDLDAIRRHDASTRQARGDNASLGENAREGMYAFRVLYYRCVGEAPRDQASPFIDAHWLAVAARYPRIFPKAAAYAAAARLRGPLRRALTHGLYL